MSINNPDVDTSPLEAVLNLQRRINAIVSVGVICHCSVIEDVEGFSNVSAKRLVYNENSVRRIIGTWSLAIDPTKERVYMLRTAGNSNLAKLRQVYFNASDNDEMIAEKLFQAIEDLRQANGIDASDEDKDALLEAIRDNY